MTSLFCLQRFIMWYLARCAVDSHRLDKEVNIHVGNVFAPTLASTDAGYI